MNVVYVILSDVIIWCHWFLPYITRIVRSFCNFNAKGIKFGINVGSNQCINYQVVIERYVHNFRDVTARF